MRLGWIVRFSGVAFLLATPSTLGGGRFTGARGARPGLGQSNGHTRLVGFHRGVLGSASGDCSPIPGHLYFMEAAAIPTLISAGHWLEAR